MRDDGSRAAFEAALAELLEAAASLIGAVVWSPEALPRAERLSAAVRAMEELVDGDG